MEEKKVINVVAYWNGLVEISSNDVELLDEMSRYLYNTYTGFIKNTTFNREEKTMCVWDRRNYLQKVLSWCVERAITFNWTYSRTLN